MEGCAYNIKSEKIKNKKPHPLALSYFQQV